MKLASETVAQYEARIEAEIARLNGGPLTVNNSADNYGLNTDGQGPEGWFDSTVNGRDLQIYNLRRRDRRHAHRGLLGEHERRRK